MNHVSPWDLRSSAAGLRGYGHDMTESSESERQESRPRAAAEASHEVRVEDGYYIYGLVDPRALHETGGDPLLSIFYVGKGRR